MNNICGGTKKQEYLRTIDLLNTIYKEQGLYFVLSFLWDSGYNRKDIHEMMKLIIKKEEEKNV